MVMAATCRKQLFAISSGENIKANQVYVGLLSPCCSDQTSIGMNVACWTRVMIFYRDLYSRRLNKFVIIMKPIPGIAAFSHVHLLSVVYEYMLYDRSEEELLERRVWRVFVEILEETRQN